MTYNGLRNINGSGYQIHASSQIGILCIEKETLVETAQMLEQVGADHHETSGCKLDLK